MKLDVGCGNNPRGDVNCDLYIKDIFNHRDRNMDTLNPKVIPNFVLCDARHLPFKKDAFEEVFCSQLIEHMEHPWLFLKELVRVSNDLVTVETVSRLGEAFLTRYHRDWTDEHHISKFTRRSFVKVAPLLGCKISNGYVLNYYGIPFAPYLEFIKFPYGIGIQFQKNSTGGGD